MKLYCAACGIQLRIIRKAVPKLAIIVDVVEPHLCSQEVRSFTDLPDFCGVPKFLNEPDSYKFVQSLNALGPRSPINQDLSNKVDTSIKRSMMTGTDDLRDRRFDTEPQQKSSAPGSIAEQIRLMQNSIPSHDLKGPEDDKESEMGD
jgi:hypothetical protein